MDGNKHHWYHIRSAAKNTLKIFDPEECQDRDFTGDARRGPLHSGTPLVPSDNLGGQMFETAISTSNGEYNMAYGPPSQGQANGLNYKEMGNVIKYEHVPGEYTYTVGDATEAYTRKIDYFQRELLFLRPDVFVVFDRVRTVDPSYKKVWTLHTVDEPVAKREIKQGMGLKSVANSYAVTITDSENMTYIDAVYPTANRIKIRGGDSILSQGHSLNSSQSVPHDGFLETDIPRWLEVFAVGPDVEGSITLTGDALEGQNVSEILQFEGTKVQTYVVSSPSSTTTTSLQDTSQHWQTNQWAGHVLRTRRSGGGEDVVISGNDADTLLLEQEYNTQNVWGYYILRPVANTYYHWNTIHSATTTDMDIHNLIVSAPHYFDTEDAMGNVYSFSPHTDSLDDGYRKREDIGQWTLEIEATNPKKEDVFLNVISLKDPGSKKPSVQRLKGDNVSGALIDSTFVAFANGVDALDSATLTFPVNGEVKGIFCNLTPNTPYSYNVEGNTITLSRNGTVGTMAQSSDMGLLSATATLTGKRKSTIIFPVFSEINGKKTIAFPIISH